MQLLDPWLTNQELGDFCVKFRLRTILVPITTSILFSGPVTELIKMYFNLLDRLNLLRLMSLKNG